MSAESDAPCWRHVYAHREYVCTCSPPVAGDTGREDSTCPTPPVSGTKDAP